MSILQRLRLPDGRTLQEAQTTTDYRGRSRSAERMRKKVAETIRKSKESSSARNS